MHAMATPQGIPVRDPDSNESVIGTVDMFYRCGHVSLGLPTGGSILIIDPCIGQRVYDNESESHCGACVVLMDTFLHFRRMTMTMRICDDVVDNSQKNKVHAKANLFLGLMASEARTISSLQRFGKRFAGELIDKLEEVVDSRSSDCRARLDRANDAHCPLCGNIAMFQELSAHVSAASGSDPRYKMKVIHSLYLYSMSRVFDGRVHTRAYTEGLCLVADTDERPFDWDSSSRALLPIGFNRAN